MTPSQHCVLIDFLDLLRSVPWFQHCGEPSEFAIVPNDLVEAWDHWNSLMLATWLPAIHALEQLAEESLGEACIEDVFEAISQAMGDRLLKGMENYFDRRPANSETNLANADRGLWPEWLETVKRDLCWAAIEVVSDQRGFFSDLLPYYRAGRWPCAWDTASQPHRIVML